MCPMPPNPILPQHTDLGVRGWRGAPPKPTLLLGALHMTTEMRLASCLWRLV
jgi:hypothetical protein